MLSILFSVPVLIAFTAGRRPQGTIYEARTVFMLGGKGEKLGYASRDGLLCVWNLSDGKAVCSMELGGPTVFADITDDDQKLIAANQDGRVVIYDLRKKEGVFFDKISGNSVPSSLVPKSHLFVSFQPRCPPWRAQLELRELEKAQLIRHLGPKGGFLSPYIFSTDGTAILICDSSGRSPTGLYAVADNRLLSSWSRSQRRLSVSMSRFPLDKDLFVDRAGRTSLELRRARTGEPVLRVDSSNTDIAYIDAWLTEDGKYLAFIGQLWDGVPPGWAIALGETQRVPVVGCWVWSVEDASLVSVFVLKTVESPWAILERKKAGAVMGLLSEGEAYRLYYLDYLEPQALAVLTEWDLKSGRPVSGVKIAEFGRDLDRIEREGIGEIPTKLRESMTAERIEESARNGGPGHE